MRKSENELARLIGINISTRRRRLGLTQAQLAEQLGLGQESLSRMEKGLISPKVARLRCFAKELQCSVPDLFRPPVEGLTMQASAIVDILRPLSPKKREILVNLLGELARVMDG